MMRGLNKHDNEVQFLEAAAALNLLILQTRESVSLLSHSQFPGLPTPRPQYPNKPTKPQEVHIAQPIHEKVEWLSHLLSNADGDSLGWVTWVEAETRFYSTGSHRQNNLEGKYIRVGDSRGAAGIGLFQTPKAMRRIHSHNATVKALYDFQVKQAKEKYSKDVAVYQQLLAAYPSQIEKYEVTAADYEQHFSAAEKSFYAIRTENLNILNRKLNDATEKLDSLYKETRMLPKPYQYPETVFYLYDFLSSSSDEYDIKYALERVDLNEIKQMMAETLQNQSRQMRLFGTLLAAIVVRLDQLCSTEDDIDVEQFSGVERTLVESQKLVVDYASQVELMKPLP
jgi:hypothetical protein